MNTNETEIRNLIETWANAVRTRDIEAIMAHHSEDLVMYDVPPPFQSIGKDAYRKTWDQFFNDTKLGVFDFHNLKVIADENVAFCFGTMKCEFKNDSDQFVELNFRLTVGLKKISGQWTIIHEHHSVPSEE
jgi:uncharacterized protein (TIGR02246 family)